MKDETRAIDTRLMQDLYANTLRVMLRQLKTASAKELSQVSSVEISAVRELASKLCLSGEFLEEQIAGGDEKRYRFNPEHKLALAICVLGKDRVFAAVSDLYGEYLTKDEIFGSPDTLEFFDGVVEKYLTKYPAIAFLAFGMAGFEESLSGLLLTVDFPKLELVHFRDHFMEKYGLPSVLENEIKAAVLAFYEKRHFGEDKCVTALYVPPSYGPVAAICIDGKLYRGRNNAAGEVIFLNTDVKWKHFEYHEPNYSKLKDPLKLIADMVLPMIVYLNPDCLVIYSSWLPLHTGETLHELLLEAVPKEFIPDLVFVPGILPDLLDGLVHLALKAMEPVVDFGETN
jgi:hypothetical protein